MKLRSRCKFKSDNKPPPYAKSGLPPELPPAAHAPSLKLFPEYNSKIEWLEYLGPEEGSGQGFVFRARVRKREYAIKVFKFHDPNCDEPFWQPLFGNRIPLSTLTYYTDPFYAECRAYGRIETAIKKRGLKANAAISTYGYTFLGDRDIKALREFDVEFVIPNTDYQETTIEKFRPRAIVKELALSDPGVSVKNLKQILKNIIRLNNIGIYNRDIHMENFIGGRLCDFGSSWTAPHIFLDAIDYSLAITYLEMDRDQFDYMVENMKIDPRNVVKANHAMRLRPRV